MQPPIRAPTAAPTQAEETEEEQTEAAAGAVTDPMFQYTALEWLALATPLLSVTGLIITLLIVATPVLRREPAAPRRRRAAKVLAIVALIVAAPLAVLSWSLGVFGLLLLGGLAIPSILTLARLRQLPPTEPTP